MSPEFVLTLLAAAVQSGTPILYATLGEMCDVLRDEWGEYVETAAAMKPC